MWGGESVPPSFHKRAFFPDAANIFVACEYLNFTKVIYADWARLYIYEGGVLQQFESLSHLHVNVDDMLNRTRDYT